LVPKGFTDIHSHVIPGIDDGAKTMDDSIALIKKFQELGIHKIITTPHVMGGVWPNSTEVITSKLQEVKERLQEEGITEFSIEAAAEYMLDENFIELLEKKDLLPIKENKILVEMSYLNPPSNLFDTLFAMQIAGYKPVLAHPERYNFYHMDKAKYADLKRAGAHFQLNLLALTKYYGLPVQKTALYLLEKNMYNYVATDAHHLRHLENMNFVLSKKHRLLLEGLLRDCKEGID
jgi:tyrosine-protein phosphatase YwqE